MKQTKPNGISSEKTIKIKNANTPKEVKEICRNDHYAIFYYDDDTDDTKKVKGISQEKLLSSLWLNFKDDNKTSHYLTFHYYDDDTFSINIPGTKKYQVFRRDNKDRWVCDIVNRKTQK